MRRVSGGWTAGSAVLRCRIGPMDDTLEDLIPGLREYREQREQDCAVGVARIGGDPFNLPEYPYTEAARVLVDHAAEGDLASFAMPCVYLQRHALELILKGLWS